MGGTGSGVELVILLLEGVLERLVRAKRAMEAKDRAEQVKLIDKLLEIISEGLRAHLDMKAGGELAQRLDDLYGYCCIRLLEANSRNDVKMLDEVSDLLNPLLAAWRELRGSQSDGRREQNHSTRPSSSSGAAKPEGMAFAALAAYTHAAFAKA